MKEEILEIIFMIVVFSVFLSGFMVIYFRFEKHRIEEEKERKRLL